MYELELFAGAGGGILGSLLRGHTCIGAVEVEEYPRKVLLQRQRDGILPEFPIWDDVTTFRIEERRFCWPRPTECTEYIQTLRSIRENLTISGGFPCQDISSAGKGAGITENSRSGLWFEFARIIREIRPARVFVENSPVLTSRGLGIVLGDLAEMGYNAKWGVLGAVDVGAPHKRERIWIKATNANIKYDDYGGYGTSQIFRKRSKAADISTGKKSLANTAKEGLPKRRQTERKEIKTEARARMVNESERCGCDVADSMRYRSQRGREKRSAKGSSGLCSGKRGDKEQCLLSDTNKSIGSQRSSRKPEKQQPCSLCKDVPRKQQFSAVNKRSSGEGENSFSDSRNNRDVERIGELRESESTSQSRNSDGGRAQVYEVGEWWAVEPQLGRVANGVANRVDRLKSIGNGQVPKVENTAQGLLE